MDERRQESEGVATEVGSLEVLSLDGKGASSEELAQARRTVAFLEGLAPALADDGDAAQALHDLGQLLLHPLNQPAEALEALRAAYGRRTTLHIARAYRKAALRAGSVEDQLSALEGEARAATTPAYRASLETERGALLEKSGNTTAARQAYAAAIDSNPNEITALLAQLRLALRDGEPGEAVASCRRLAEATADPRVKAEYLTWAGRLLEASGDLAAAQAAGVQAEVHGPDSPSVAFLLERLLAAGDQPRELCARLEAQITEGALPAGEGWFDIGVLARYHLGDLEAAERAFVQAADKAQGASKAAVQAELADLWARKGQWQKVLAAEEAVLPDGGDALGRAVAWTRIAQLREEQLGDLDGAADAYKTAIEAAPAYLPALEGAGRAFARQSDIERLLWMHRAEAENAASPAERATALRRAGELLLEDPARAVQGLQLLQEALTAAPEHAGIFATLERVLRQRGAFAELAELYQRELERVTEPRRSAWLLLQIGELAADRLNDNGRAIDAFRNAAAIPGGAPHIALTRLAQLLEDTGDLTALESVLEQLTSWTDDPVQLASLYERAAQLQEKRGDVEAALESHRRGLDVAPQAHSIQASAGRAFLRAERWDDLLGLYERAATDGSDGETATYGYKSGLLLARKMGRVEDGIARLEAVRAAAPRHVPTLVALAGLYQEAQRWAELRPILAELPSTPALGVRRAALAEVTGHPDEALSLWEAALEAGVTVAARPRARLLARLGRWPQLAALYETTQPNGTGNKWAAHARYRAAEIFVERTKERGRGAELLAAALAAEPESLPLMLALLRALDDDAPARRTTLTGVVGRLRDPAFRAALLGQLAANPQLAEGESLATRVNQMALAPRDPVVAVRIEVALEARHNREALAALLRDLRRDPKANEALVAAAAARLGSLLEELGTLRDAADAYEASVASAHPSFLARLALPRVYGALGDETRLNDALRGLADALPAGAVRAAALRRLAAHHQHKRADSAAAATTLEAALQSYPLDYESLRALDALVGAAQPERLIDPLLRAFAAEPAGAQRLSVGLALAARLLRADRLGPARETLERILADEPAHLEALYLRAEIEGRAESWPQMVEALGAIADHRDAPPERQTEALRRMTEVQLKLEDLTAARATADRLGTVAPDDLESMLVRLQVAARAEDHAHAAELLRRLVQSPRIDEERQAALQLQLASLQEVKLDDVAGAIQTLGEIKLGSRRRDAVDRLLDLGGRTNRWDLAASALEATLDRSGDMDAQWELAIRSRLANLLEGPLARPESAIRQYERIVAIDRGHVPALERLAELAIKSAPEKAIDYHRALLSSDPTRLGSYRALRTLFAQLGEEDGAFVTEAILESLGVADEEEAYFYRQRRARLVGHVEGVLTDEEKSLLSPEAATPPFAVLHVLTPLLDSVFPVDFVGYGTDEDKPAHAGPSMAAANRAARLYGVDSFRLMSVPNRVGPCVEPGTPPVLFVPANVDDAPPREQASVLGELMARIAFGCVIGDGRRLSAISPQLLEHLLWAACEVALPDAVAPQRGKPVYEDVKRRLAGAVGMRWPKTEMALAASRLLADDSFSGAAILAAMERIALRASLFSAQDPAIAIARARPGGGGGLEALPPNLRAVLPFVVSRGHLELRKRLGVGVRA